MYQVKNLYVVVEDDEGHSYLIPREDYLVFNKCLTKAERDLNNYLDSHGWDSHDYDEDYAYELRQAVWDCFDGYDRLEGERHYVVLLDDVVE